MRVSAPAKESGLVEVYGRRVAALEARTEWPLATLALMFLGAYAWPILDPQLPMVAKHACAVLNLVIWLVFAIEYLVRLFIAKRPLHYWAHHLPDFAIVVLPALRPLRLLRLLMLLKVLNRRAASSLRGRVGAYVSGAAAILLFCSSVAVLDAERNHAEATITTFGDALWWSFVTVSTVGYGDLAPVSGGGRLVGVGLMLAGVALLGVVTATFASWLVDRVREVSESEQALTKADIAQMRQEITELRELIVKANPEN